MLGEGAGEVSCSVQRTGTDGSQRFTSSDGATSSPKRLHPGPVRRWERGVPAARLGWALQGSHPSLSPMGRAGPGSILPKAPGTPAGVRHGPTGGPR